MLQYSWLLSTGTHQGAAEKRSLPMTEYEGFHTLYGVKLCAVLWLVRDNGMAAGTHLLPEDLYSAAFQEVTPISGNAPVDLAIKFACMATKIRVCKHPSY